MKKRSNIKVMASLIGLVKPLTGYMILAILMGIIGYLCASFITIFGGYALLDVLGFSVPLSALFAFISLGVFAFFERCFKICRTGLQPFYSL